MSNVEKTKTKEHLLTECLIVFSIKSEPWGAVIWAS